MNEVWISRRINLIITRTDALNVNAFGFFQPDSLRTLHPTVAGIRTRQRNTVRELDGFAVGAPDNRCNDIAFIENPVAARTFPVMFTGICRETAGFGSGGRQREETVAAVDAQNFGDGTETVSRIKIPVAAEVVIG